MEETITKEQYKEATELLWEVRKLSQDDQRSLLSMLYGAITMQQIQAAQKEGSVSDVRA